MIAFACSSGILSPVVAEKVVHKGHDIGTVRGMKSMYTESNEPLQNKDSVENMEGAPNCNVSAPPMLPAVCRRVIFPSLHESKDLHSKIFETLDAAKSAENKSENRFYIKRIPSLDSINSDEPMHPLTPLSPLFIKSTNPKEGSPRTVSCTPAFEIPALPSLRQFADHSKRNPPTSCALKQRTVTTPQEETVNSNAVNDTLSHYRRVIAPFSVLRSSVPLTECGEQPNTLEGPQQLKSILRNKVKDIESIPSLVSMTPSEISQGERRITFDPRVWVCEFQREKAEFTTTWYSASEMDRFKRRAVERVCSYADLVPTGTGRLVRKRLCSKALFTNPALMCDDDEDEFAIQRLARLELHNILVVDPHDVCLKLFAKGFKEMLPHAVITTVKSAEEALKRVEKRGSCKPFDLVLVEERLKLLQESNDHHVSGSSLIKLLIDQFSCAENEKETLCIGVSAHYEKDKNKLEASGASFTWPKPPPDMDKTMRNKLLKEILIMRGKEQTALKYFH